MQVKRSSILFLFIIIITTANGQSFNCTRYNLNEGLVASNISHIFQDSKGFIWIGTMEGLSRHDGYRFTNYTVKNGFSSPLILDIVEFEPGRLIIAPNANLPVIINNGIVDTVNKYSRYAIEKFIQKDNKPWVALTDHAGVLQYKENRFVPVDSINKTLIDDLVILNDSLFIGNVNDNLRLYDSQFRPCGIEMLYEFTFLYKDNDGNVWIGTKNGLKLADKKQQCGKDVSFAPLPSWLQHTPAANAHIKCVLKDRDGRFWIGTEDGLLVVDNNGSYRSINTSNGLSSNIVTCLFQDKEDNIWAGTSNGLVKITLKNKFRVIKTTDGLPTSLVHHVVPFGSSSAYLFSGGRSVLDLTDGSIKVSETYPAGSNAHFRTTTDEVVVIKNGFAEVYTAGNADHKKISWPALPPTFAVQKINDDNYFIGRQEGFAMRLGNEIFYDSTTMPYRVSACAKDQEGNLWVGTWGNGFYKLVINDQNNKISWKIKKMSRELVGDSAIRSMYVDADNRLWVGTRWKGAICLQIKEDTLQPIYQFNTNTHLSSNHVSDFRQDDQKNIWVGTWHGIDKLIPTANGYRVFNFSKMHNSPLAAVEIYLLPGKQLFAGCIDGLVLATDEQTDQTLPPSCFITMINDEIGLIQHNINDGSDKYLLSYKNPHINFQFTAPLYLNEQMVQFSYRLLGSSDSSWQTADQSRSVNFANLSSGNYTFEVRAMGWNGEWGTPGMFSFSVSTPFYQQRWFIVLCAAVLLYAGYQFYKYRLKQLLRVQKIRDDIAADLHDEIGGTLTNIQILSTLTRKQMENPKMANDYLERISEETNATQQALDDIIWSVNSNNEELEQMIFRMRRYAAEVFDGKAIDYQIDMDDKIGGLKLDMQQRRDIFLVFKELVNNIARHANASNVKVAVHITGKQIYLTISDDGLGFDQQNHTNRNGLKNMRTRISRWGGTMQIISKQAEGTTVKIELSVKSR